MRLIIKVICFIINEIFNNLRHAPRHPPNALLIFQYFNMYGGHIRTKMRSANAQTYRLNFKKNVNMIN